MATPLPIVRYAIKHRRAWSRSSPVAHASLFTHHHPLLILLTWCPGPCSASRLRQAPATCSAIQDCRPTHAPLVNRDALRREKPPQPKLPVATPVTSLTSTPEGFPFARSLRLSRIKH
uniref:Uncharacterized protein n=1 Tax=Setaria viridis TaxID=4556 RepID=A0A4U6TR81_SETVI|nr:hypothetical protein SEVIR_7G074600v2 [Setaria viridis]